MTSIFPLVVLCGGCWSRSQLHLGEGRIHPRALCEDMGFIPCSKLPQCSEGVLGPLMLPAPFPTCVHNLDLNQKPSASQHLETELLPPPHISIFLDFEKGEIASYHLSCGTPMHSVHDGVVFNLISFQMTQRGGCVAG